MSYIICLLAARHGAAADGRQALGQEGAPPVAEAAEELLVGIASVAVMQVLDGLEVLLVRLRLDGLRTPARRRLARRSRGLVMTTLLLIITTIIIIMIII